MSMRSSTHMSTHMSMHMFTHMFHGYTGECVDLSLWHYIVPGLRSQLPLSLFWGAHDLRLCVYTHAHASAQTCMHMSVCVLECTPVHMTAPQVCMPQAASRGDGGGALEATNRPVRGRHLPSIEIEGIGRH